MVLLLCPRAPPCGPPSGCAPVPARSRGLKAPAGEEAAYAGEESACAGNESACSCKESGCAGSASWTGYGLTSNPTTVPSPAGAVGSPCSSAIAVSVPSRAQVSHAHFSSSQQNVNITKSPKITFNSGATVHLMLHPSHKENIANSLFPSLPTTTLKSFSQNSFPPARLSASSTNAAKNNMARAREEKQAIVHPIGPAPL